MSQWVFINLGDAWIAIDQVDYFRPTKVGSLIVHFRNGSLCELPGIGNDELLRALKDATDVARGRSGAVSL